MTTGVLMSPVSHSASLVKAKAVDNGMQERKLMADFYCISLYLIEKVAENGDFRAVFRHQSFRVLSLCCSRFRQSISPLFSLPLHTGTYFGSTSSVPQMDFPSSILRFMAHGIHETVFSTRLHPRFPTRHFSLPFSRTRTSSYEYTTAAIPTSYSPFLLDRSCVP
jgi:hypothetical protein